MVKIKLLKLEEFLYNLFHALGMNAENAEVETDIFMRATLRGVSHHDIYDLPARLKNYASGKININPSIKLISKYNALECYDGDNGPGEICCNYIMERAEEMADEFGIAFCTIRNSNHFLAAAPYVEKAAEKGYIAIIFSRTNPSMNAPGSTRKMIGSSPLGFAASTHEDSPILLDICLAYASQGLLKAKAKAGESVPSYWGIDSTGLPSTDPAAILNGGVASPIGGHKGFGLSIMTEILTGVLSGGELIDERYPEHVNGAGVYSQSVIVIRPDGFMPQKTFKYRTTKMVERMKNIYPEVHIPGQRSYSSKKKMMAKGGIEISQELFDSLIEWAKGFGIKPLEHE